MELVSRAWFRLHYLCVTADIDPSQWYTGPVVSVLLKCATRGTQAKANTTKPNPTSTRRNNGSTVERDTRDGLYFLMRKCCLQIPGIVAPAVKHQHWSQRLVADSSEPVSILIMWRLEAAVHDTSLSDVVRATSAHMLDLGCSCLRCEQANRSEIWESLGEIAGCLHGCTDREKSNEPRKMVARPFWIPCLGLWNDKLWLEMLLKSTAHLEAGGILFPENDAKDANPFHASKHLRRPMHRNRMRQCIRAVLIEVCGVPSHLSGRFGISSFRKFLEEVAVGRKISHSRYRLTSIILTITSLFPIILSTYI